MSRKHSIFTGILAAAIGLIPQTCAAAIDGTKIQQIAYDMITTAKPLWVAIGAFCIIAGCLTLILSQEEGQLDKLKKTIVAVIVGGMTIMFVVTLGPNLIGFVYNGVGTFQGNNAAIELETRGVANWILSLAGITGVLMTIIALVEAVVGFGADEAAYTKVRTAVIHIVMGLMTIIGAGIIRTTLFVNHEPSAILLYVFSKLNIALNFLLIIAVAILIYAGFRMVISFGKEDDYNNSKSLVIRVVVGIVVIAISEGLVHITLYALS